MEGQVQPFAGAVLQFGAYDLSGQSPSGRTYADEWFIQAYARHVADRTDPDVSPLYGDLRGLPPALLVVGTLDILLEDSLALAARLSAAGNQVDLRLFPESPHGWLYVLSDGHGHGRPGQHRVVACGPAGRSAAAVLTWRHWCGLQ
jgi:acetyl esterase